MKSIVVAASTELGRHLSRYVDREMLRRSELSLVVTSSLQEMLDRVYERGADLCLLGMGVADGSAAATVDRLRADARSAHIPLVLLLGPGEQLRGPTSQKLQDGIDDVIELPTPPEALALVFSRLLGISLREGERFPVRVHVFSEAEAEGDLAGADGPPPDQLLGTTIDLSEVGLLLKTRRQLPLSERLTVRFTLPGRPGELDLRGRVVRIDDKSFAPDLALGLCFESVSEVDRRALRSYLAALLAARPFRWYIQREGDRQVISLAGVLRADADLTPLRQLRGALDFRMKEFRRISSDSIQSWLDLVRSLRGASSIRLFECPIPFIQQANAISNLLESTQVMSFYAPYTCSRCGLDEERLIDVATDLKDLPKRPPTPPRFSCTACRAPLVFDDIPERYFAFLS